MINSIECARKIEKKKQWNGQNQKKLKYHFKCEVKQFQRNEICNMLIDIQTLGHKRKDATVVD